MTQRTFTLTLDDVVEAVANSASDTSKRIAVKQYAEHVLNVAALTVEELGVGFIDCAEIVRKLKEKL